MAKFRTVAVIFLALALGGSVVRGASSAENRAYAAAVKAYEDHLWEFAENAFAKFAEKYPKSERRAEAILFQAQSEFCQATNLMAQHHPEPARKKLAQAIELLTAQLSAAGSEADQY